MQYRNAKLGKVNGCVQTDRVKRCLVIVLGLYTRIKKTINFVHFLYKNTITNTPNHISINKKINYWIKLINFVLKIENDAYFVTKKILYNDTYSETEGVKSKLNIIHLLFPFKITRSLFRATRGLYTIIFCTNVFLVFCFTCFIFFYI